MSQEERDEIASETMATTTTTIVNKRKRGPTGEVEGSGDGNKKPSSLITLFTTQDGTRTGPPIEIPINSTSKQLDTLINTLLENTDPVSDSSTLLLSPLSPSFSLSSYPTPSM
jgi:hypothetical protein